MFSLPPSQRGLRLVCHEISLDHSADLGKVWLTTNDIGPSYENNELGLGGSVVSKALTKTSGITSAALKKLYNKHGDPGDVAFEARVKQRTLMMKEPTPLSDCSNPFAPPTQLWKIKHLPDILELTHIRKLPSNQKCVRNSSKNCINHRERLSGE